MDKGKKLIALFIVLTMICTLLAGCTQSTTTATTGGTTSTTKGATTTAATTTTTAAGNTAFPSEIPPIIKTDPSDMLWMRDISPVTLTMYKNTMKGTDWEGWGSDTTTSYITERTGITLDIEYAPDTEGTRINLMLAGGEQLPDLLSNISFNSPLAAQLIEGGYVLCAEDLINEYAPEYWDLYSIEQQKDFATATSDGKMWAFADGFEFDGESYYGYMHGYAAVRNDILEAMGKTNLDIKTLDDFYAALDEFETVKDQFPAVEYPVYLKGIRPQFTAFMGDIGAGAIRYDATADSLYFWFESDAGYNTLKMFNKLFRDGYLKEESIITSNPVIDDLGAGKAFFYFENNVWASSSANTPLKTNIGPDAWMMPVYPFTSDPDQTMLRTFKGVTFNGNSCWISADSENIERALGYLEYMTTEEGILTLNCGIFGEHWEVDYDSNGEPYPKFIGEAGELAHSGKINDAKLKFGFNNFSDALWSYHTFSYNFLWNYDINIVNSILPENLKQARILWYRETTDNADLAGVPNMAPVDRSTDAGITLTNLENIFNSELVKAVFTNSDAEFESTYQNMLSSLEAAGRDQFFDLYRPTFDAKLELYKKVLNQ